MRLQVLEKLAASVPYAEACANAEAKLDHITGNGGGRGSEYDILTNSSMRQVFGKTLYCCYVLHFSTFRRAKVRW